MGGAVVPWTVALCVVVALILTLSGLAGALIRPALRGGVALLFLAALQQWGTGLGLSLGVNLFNAAVLALLGAPGFGLLLLLG